jgi:AbrB family looped-hinge helix DNA binding protein
MNIVTVSPKFQVVIPLAVRERMKVEVGQKMVVLAYDNRIVLIPQRPIQQARGMFKHAPQLADLLREEEDEER